MSRENCLFLDAIDPLFKRDERDRSRCRWRPNPTIDVQSCRAILSILQSRAFYLESSISKTIHAYTSAPDLSLRPLPALSCTTRRDECARGSHNLRLSWQLLCGLCMIFYHVGEFRKHGLRKPAKRLASIIDIGVTCKGYLRTKGYLAYSRIFAGDTTFLHPVIKHSPIITTFYLKNLR